MMQAAQPPAIGRGLRVFIRFICLSAFAGAYASGAARAVATETGE